jgi:SnoaL-like domain
MSRRDDIPTDNIALVWEYWSLWNDDGLTELVARFDEFFTDDLEWHSPIAAMSGRRHVGRAGFERHVADLIEGFVGIRADPQAVAEIATDVVRSDVLIHGEGPSSGVTVDAPLIALARLRDIRVYWAWASFDLEAGERLAAALARGERVEV